MYITAAECLGVVCHHHGDVVARSCPPGVWSVCGALLESGRLELPPTASAAISHRTALEVGGASVQRSKCTFN